MIPWLAGGALATAVSTALLTLPAVLTLRWLLGRRLAAPLERGRVERRMVLAAAVVGGMGAVAWADGIALGLGRFDAELASILLGFLAPVPLASVPWFAGEALSGVSQRPWFSLICSALVSSVASWASYAICWKGARSFMPEMAVIQLAASMVAGLSSAHTYLMTRGEARAQLPAAAVAIEDL